MQYIDEACKNRQEHKGKWVVTKPMEASGTLKWKIRMVKAWKVLSGKADAFKYKKQ